MRIADVIAGLGLLAACAGCASRRPPPAAPMPAGGFAFAPYERLPGARKSARGVALQAQRDLDARFPPGSELKAVVETLTAAGAACTPGREAVGAYVACYYKAPRRLSLVHTDWSVIVRCDPARTRVTRIEVNRYFTGGM